MTTTPQIPGSFVDPATVNLRWEYVDTLPAPPISGAGKRQFYTATVADGQLRAMVSRDGGRRHLSVLHYPSKDAGGRQVVRCPTYDELKHAKHHLVPEDCKMALEFMPRSEAAVDIAPSCLHLWECP